MTCRRSPLLVLACLLPGCANPAPTLPAFQSPHLPGGPAPAAASSAPAPASAQSPTLETPGASPREASAPQIPTTIAGLQLSIARAQRERGDLRDSLEALSTAEADGPTGRNLKARLAGLEEQIRTMSRELIRLTSTP